MLVKEHELYKKDSFKALYDEHVCSAYGLWGKIPIDFEPDLEGNIVQAASKCYQVNSDSVNHGIMYYLKSKGL